MVVIFKWILVIYVQKYLYIVMNQTGFDRYKLLFVLNK